MGELSKQAKKLKKELRESLNDDKKYCKGFESAILKLPNDHEKIEFLLKSLAEVKPIESLQLLFRGSKDGFKASTFHEKCDNISDTVVIVLTDGQTNNTVAGYSHCRWNEVNDKWLKDARRKAFLLQLNRQEKYIPQYETNLIWCNNMYGPTFGCVYGGFDLYISDDCNLNNNTSHSCFPYTYNIQGPDKIVKDQQSVIDFCGATNRCYFRVIDYEVFKVVFK